MSKNKDKVKKKVKNGGGTVEPYLTPLEERESRIRHLQQELYPNGTAPDYLFAFEDKLRSTLLERAKTAAASLETQEHLHERCQKIRDKIHRGEPGNIEIQLNKGRQILSKRIEPLGNTAIKLRYADGSKLEYIFLKSGDRLDAIILLEDGSASGIMIVRDENGDDHFIRLDEIYMISIQNVLTPNKYVALMTSYNILTGSVYTSAIIASTMYPIIGLLLSDWLLSEWQQAKDAAAQSCERTGKEELNG